MRQLQKRTISRAPRNVCSSLSPRLASKSSISKMWSAFGSSSESRWSGHHGRRSDDCCVRTGSNRSAQRDHRDSARRLSRRSSVLRIGFSSFAEPGTLQSFRAIYANLCPECPIQLKGGDPSPRQQSALTFRSRDKMHGSRRFTPWRSRLPTSWLSGHIKTELSSCEARWTCCSCGRCSGGRSMDMAWCRRCACTRARCCR
jgi:hypothetical protein